MTFQIGLNLKTNVGVANVEGVIAQASFSIIWLPIPNLVKKLSGSIIWLPIPNLVKKY